MSSPPLPTNFSLASNQQLEGIKQLCLLRFDFFCAAIMKLQVTPFHAEMISHWLSPQPKLGTWTAKMLLAPRGWGKSKICDTAFIIWLLLKDPNLRICLISKTGPQVKGFLEEIKQHFENNEDLRLIFGDYVGEDKWNEDEIIISKRTKILKEPTICAKAVGSGIPSYHFDVIMADDLCDPENTGTELQREKMLHWFDVALSPTLEPWGDFYVIGTRYSVGDLYGTLSEMKEIEETNPITNEVTKRMVYKRNKFGPNTLVIPALVMNDDGEEVSNWEAMWPAEHLKQQRSEGLLAFNLAYQNDTRIKEGGIIRIEDLEAAAWTFPADLPARHDMVIYQGIDPAISQKQTSDFFAHATIGVHGRQIYVLELILIRLKFDDQVKLCIAKRHQWQPALVGVEVVAYQQALSQSIQEHDVWFPVHEIRPNKDKEFRARVFSQFTDQRQLHLHTSMHATMETLAGMPHVKFDDAFDAIDHAITAAKQQILNRNPVARMPTNFRRAY